MTERTVRFTEDFFDRLEELLPAERGADGIPSITDFLAFEIPGLRDLLAADAIRFTTATVIHGVRAYVNGGVLVPAILLTWPSTITMSLCSTSRSAVKSR